MPEKESEDKMRGGGDFSPSLSSLKDLQRFDSQGMAAKIDHVGCENPDGEKVLVVTNSGASHSVVLQTPTAMAELNLPGNSVTTLTWK